MQTSGPHSYILLKNTPPYSRGELLQLGEYGYDAHDHVRFISTSLSMTRPGADKIAPLTEEKCVLLDGIRNCADRYTVYSTPGRLAWGLGLKVGDYVLARLPDRFSSSAGGQQNQYTTAIIKWAGQPRDYTGRYTRHMFGVEITVSTVYTV